MFYRRPLVAWLFPPFSIIRREDFDKVSELEKTVARAK